MMAVVAVWSHYLFASFSVYTRAYTCLVCFVCVSLIKTVVFNLSKIYLYELPPLFQHLSVIFKYLPATFRLACIV